MQKNPPVFPPEPQISEELKNVIRKMMTYDRDQRITWDQLFKEKVFDLEILKENFDPLLWPPFNDDDDKDEKIDLAKIEKLVFIYFICISSKILKNKKLGR